MVTNNVVGMQSQIGCGLDPLIPETCNCSVTISEIHAYLKRLLIIRSVNTMPQMRCMSYCTLPHRNCNYFTALECRMRVSYILTRADKRGAQVVPPLFFAEWAPAFVWAPQAKRIYQIVQMIFEYYISSSLLRNRCQSSVSP